MRLKNESLKTVLVDSVKFMWIIHKDFVKELKRNLKYSVELGSIACQYNFVTSTRIFFNLFSVLFLVCL